MRPPRPPNLHLRTPAILLALALAIGACQTVTRATVLLDRTGSGSATLPAFTSRGTYDVAYSYDGCTGGVTGLILEAFVGTAVTPVTLVQTAAVKNSSGASGQAVGSVRLRVTSHCQWQLKVSG